MLKSVYIEDIFVDFFEASSAYGIPLQAQDQSAANSFYHVLAAGKELTQNQANFLLKILQKYKTLSLTAGLDYRAELQNPKWKKPFRVLDFSKKIFVEKDEQGIVFICAKFPYQLKKEFDDEFEKNNGYETSSWDYDRKLRKIKLYDTNLIQLYDFVKKHNFEIDETFMIALGEVEEIWQNQEEILPHSTIINGTVYLNNACADATDFWNNKSIGSVGDNLLLAKSMGFPCRGKPTNLIEHIAASSNNLFWIKSTEDFLSMCKSINGKICIVLDRVADSFNWIKEFADNVDLSGIDRSQVRVCFRLNKEDDDGFNSWVSENGFGGKVQDGKFLIFLHKPAKWLFKVQEDVKILVSNNIYPTTNATTGAWYNSHPCVIFLGDIKPSEQRGRKIVEL
jgi:hypothetical protein